MNLVSTTIPPVAAPVKVQVLAPGGGEEVGRGFTVSGMASACVSGRVRVIVSSGTTIISDGTTVPDADGYWTYPVTATTDFTNVTVTAYCDGENPATGSSVSNGTITNTPDIETSSLLTTIGMANPPVEFSVTFRDWKGTDQSVVTVIYRYSATSHSKFMHLFTANPPKTYTVSIPNPSKGVYVTQFTFLDGQASVATRTITKRV